MPNHKCICRMLPAAILVTFLGSHLAMPAGALTINLNFDAGKTDLFIDEHGQDRTNDLRPIMEAAASYWSRIIVPRAPSP